MNIATASLPAFLLRAVLVVMVASVSAGCASESADVDVDATRDVVTGAGEEGLGDGWNFSADSERVGGSCAPSRADGAVSPEQRAFLDAIAFAEGTRNDGENDGYNVLFSHRKISDCSSHPNRRICAGRYCSTASGRYQFLTRTWNSLKLPSFKPENQDRGAVKLMARRRASVPAGRAMTATEFRNVLDKVSYEWASLPPGRYGQPLKSRSALRAVYCSEIRCP